ncbi:response regulator transcription factor [Paenibacillus sp. SYP-B4298]|uniref:response regulator transcription factor n=1 Tax=Paenibacillus sp. SYP-B4298 TaxID=2996034 RepID=UPI0022DDC970|nr:response regulator transcription factor [Paenibacillus sp. SYP-B4298]
MRTVFVVDDEPLITKGLHAILDWEQYGLRIVGSAPDGRAALEQLKQQSVDLLITDIQMPVMNGLELIKRVKAISPRTKFIVLSGYEEFQYVKEGMTLGIENYILKPINIVELESTLKLCLQDWEREEINLFRSEVDWKLLLNNVLQRWVNGEIELSEFVQRAQLLGIPQGYGHFRAVTLRLLGEGRPLQELCRIDKLAEQSEALLREQLGEAAELICFNDLADDIVVLLDSRPWKDSHLAPMLLQVAEQLHGHTGLPVWISIGSPWQPGQGIEVSYQSAKSGYEQYLMTGSRPVAIMGGWLTGCERAHSHSSSTAADGRAIPSEPYSGGATDSGRQPSPGAGFGAEGSASHGAGLPPAEERGANVYSESQAGDDVGGAAALQAEAESCMAVQPKPELESFTKKLIDGRSEEIEQHIEAVLSAPPEQAILRRQPYINAALQLMLAMKEMEGSSDYSELFMPISQLATLAELRRHVLELAGSLNERLGTEQTSYSPHVAQLLEHVQMHYGEDMSLKTLSQQLDIHPTYLGQLFHQEVGTSFSDYVNHYRIEKATQLLLHTDLKTSDIAREVGYLDSSYFYRQFKKYAGVSPTELRQMSSGT